MFGSNVVDILIGLIVVFLSVALAVSAATELISQWFSMRSTELKKALERMLVDGASNPATGVSKLDWFLGQPLLQSMQKASGEFPSYLDRKVFSEALLLALDSEFAAKKSDELVASLKGALDGLANSGAITPGARTLLASYIVQAEGDALKFRALVETWFDHVMDRTSGWYKRNVSMIALGLSAIVVFSVNIDSIAIAQALYGSDTLRTKSLEVANSLLEKREALSPATPPAADGAQPPAANGATPPAAGTSAPVVPPSANTPATRPATAASAPPAAPSASASATGASAPSAAPPAVSPAAPNGAVAMTPDARLELMSAHMKDLGEAGLPLGWKKMPSLGEVPSKLIGLLITICAASLGVPFWFDMLSKIVNIRNAGRKPITKTPVVSPPTRGDAH